MNRFDEIRHFIGSDTKQRILVHAHFFMKTKRYRKYFLTLDLSLKIDSIGHAVEVGGTLRG